MPKATQAGNAKKLKQLVDWLDEVACETADGLGHYPDDIVHIPGYLVIATLDPGKEYARPMLQVWSERAALRWYDDIVKLRQDEPAFDLWEAISECRPPEF